MTFTQIVTAITDQLNLTSPEAVARVGRSVNRVYRKVCSSVGLQVSSRTTAVATSSNGSRFMTFTGIEKISELYDQSTGQARVIDEVEVNYLRERQAPSSNTVKRYAIYRMYSGSVQIMLDVTATSTPFDLYAEGYATATDLSGTDTPNFPASFHDVLVSGVLVEEYAKKEKALWQQAKADYEDRLGDLRLYIAKSINEDIYQGKNQKSLFPTPSAGSSGGGSSLTNAFILEWVYDFDGTDTEGVTDTAYPSGAGTNNLAPDTDIYTVDCARLTGGLSTGRFTLTGMLVNAVAGKATTVALVNLTDAPDTPIIEITMTGQTITDVTSAQFTLPTSGTKAFGIKMKTASGGIATAWGLKLRKVA